MGPLVGGSNGFCGRILGGFRLGIPSVTMTVAASTATVSTPMAMASTPSVVVVIVLPAIATTLEVLAPSTPRLLALEEALLSVDWAGIHLALADEIGLFLAVVAL